ncbi:MAG: hypothetical protein GXP63_02645 [DPANN group archaeon]|nr:hypothetical protein [DPANN group archaeon]
MKRIKGRKAFLESTVVKWMVALGFLAAIIGLLVLTRKDLVSLMDHIVRVFQFGN